MINPDQDIPLTLSANQLNIVFALLNKAPYEVAAPIFARLRNQVLTIDPTAFDPPRVNGADTIIAPH